MIILWLYWCQMFHPKSQWRKIAPKLGEIFKNKLNLLLFCWKAGNDSFKYWMSGIEKEFHFFVNSFDHLSMIFFVNQIHQFWVPAFWTPQEQSIWLNHENFELLHSDSIDQQFLYFSVWYTWPKVWHMSWKFQVHRRFGKSTLVIFKSLRLKMKLVHLH